MKTIGKKIWAIPGGRIPLRSNGPEPEFVSSDELCILNAAKKDARIQITIFYTDHDPVGPYPLTVPARRTRHIRFNDLINPQAMPLDTDYACLLQSDTPVIVQFNRRDTGQAENAISGMMAFPVD
jgi:hypothetical protein